MSIDPPKTNAGYSPAHAQELDRMVASVEHSNVRHLDEAELVAPLRALCQVLESALAIAYKRHYLSEPEPYPGAAKKVIEQARALVASAHKSGLLK